MRILQVAPRYAPAWEFGGGVRMSFEIARELVKRGHTVTAYTSDQLDTTTRVSALREELEGIQVRRFRNPSKALVAAAPFAFLRPIGLQASLANLKKTVDIVHIFESRGIHVHWGAQGLSKQGIPFVWSAYGGLAPGVGIRRLYRRMYDVLYRTPAIVKSAAGLVAQTPHECDVYASFGGLPDQMRIIPLAVPWQEFRHLPSRNMFREQIGVDSAAKLILFVGRIHSTKGLDMLLRAFASLRQKEKAYLAIVGGDHGHLGTIQHLHQSLSVGEAVKFCKPIFGPERLAAYVDADVFALTSRVFDETSLAALEAAACGTQCVLTRQCEIPGLEEAGGGRVVEYDQAAIEQALLESLQPGVRERRGQRARSLVAERFTMGVIARDHERFYEEILTRHSEARRALA